MSITIEEVVQQIDDWRNKQVKIHRDDRRLDQ